MSRNNLQWITVSSEQAILMSVCLQAMIDELLLKSVGGNKTAVSCLFEIQRYFPICLFGEQIKLVACGNSLG